MDFVVVVAHWCAGTKGPQGYARSTYNGPSYLRPFCVKSAEAFWCAEPHSNGLRLRLGSASDFSHENREICRSPRGAGSLSAFRGERDGHYADRVFDFADLVLRPLPQTAKPSAPPRLTALPSSPTRTVFLDGGVGLSKPGSEASAARASHSSAQRGMPQSDQRSIASSLKAIYR
jgi:hypothetical protein